MSCLFAMLVCITRYGPGPGGSGSTESQGHVIATWYFRIIRVWYETQSEWNEAVPAL
jgi:hypothetical protein